MNDHCTSCGATVKPGEYHPWAFCVLAREGMDRKSIWAFVKQAERHRGSKSGEWLKISAVKDSEAK